jgi:hypothetical protein
MEKSSADESCGKQRETQNATAEIEVMTKATLNAPMHPGKQVKRLADMTKSDHQQTPCPE